MTLMISVLAAIIATCGTLGFVARPEQSRVLGLLVGSFLGAILALIVALAWIVLHFLGKVW